MSRPVPEEEYREKPLSRLSRWVGGETDPYLGRVESTPRKPRTTSETLRRRYRREQQNVIQHVFDQEHNWAYKAFMVFYKVVSVLCCAALIVMLLLAVEELPPVGAPDNPVNNEVAEKYIADGLEDTGAVNIVTGMILDYRAFDTFGESNVLFIATCCVLLMLRTDRREKTAAAEEEDEDFEPDQILQKIVFVLFPVIVMFGIYVIVNGHLSPGGGFSGGAIIGAALILYASAFGFKDLDRFFTERTYRWVSFGALSFYCLAKSYSFFTGANHLESFIPLGIPGDILSAGLILPLNVCVGLVVACTMYAFFTLFRKGGF